MSIFHFDLNLLWYPPNLHLFFPFCLIFLVSTRYINKDLNDFFFNESFPTIHFSYAYNAPLSNTLKSDKTDLGRLNA